MRLIDADALDEALTALRFTADGELAHWGDRKDWCLHGSEIEMLIANAPTVEAEPVRHGHWIYFEQDNMFGCSKCARRMPRNNYLYCPWCGARMDEED